MIIININSKETFSLLIICNGHGEDVIALEIIKRLLNINKFKKIEVLPLVGNGAVFDSIHQKKFNLEEINKLKDKMPDIVYIYSQNSAESFLKMIKNYNLQSLWMKTNLMCISEKTSSVLNEIKWKKIFLFNPGEEEFLLYKI